MQRAENSAAARWKNILYIIFLPIFLLRSFFAASRPKIDGLPTRLLSLPQSKAGPCFLMLLYSCLTCTPKPIDVSFGVQWQGNAVVYRGGSLLTTLTSVAMPACGWSSSLEAVSFKVPQGGVSSRPVRRSYMLVLWNECSSRTSPVSR